MKVTQDNIRSNISQEIEQNEERTEKRIVELMKGERGIEDKQLEEVIMEFINECLDKIKKKK